MITIARWRKSRSLEGPQKAERKPSWEIFIVYNVFIYIFRKIFALFAFRMYIGTYIEDTIYIDMRINCGIRNSIYGGTKHVDACRH